MSYLHRGQKLQNVGRIALTAAMVAMLGLSSGCSLVSAYVPKSRPPIRMTAESDETIENWTHARQYQAAGRYTLARQHYMLALSAVRTQSSLEQLQRELYAVDMQIKTMR